MKKLLEKLGWKIGEVDFFELNEAFAAQVLVCLDQLGIAPERTNLDGGAIALGHPLGAPGARITGKTAQLLQREGKRLGLATQHDQLGPRLRTFCTAAEHQPTDFGDRRQCLASKPERGDLKKIVRVADFTCRMARHGQRQFLGGDSRAIIGHAYKLAASFFDDHVNPRSSGIKRIFHQLLHHTRRPLDDFAGSNFVDHTRR